MTGGMSPETTPPVPRAEDRWTSALRQIINVLGPDVSCPDNECQGCQAEMGEALRIAKEALGVR